MNETRLNADNFYTNANELTNNKKLSLRTNNIFAFNIFAYLRTI